ncbi:protein kinase family protein [Actinacidiphila acididurans]|uniref:Protein kinase family protein n=1 Tax=Actinacidiphila acididurans TaxID=2784346 RepID=A0ABS2U456_9ACTN|nr:protein kinase family protein [Actinacidiphila acididurans]MBM9510404.1 protein kinase family protein [Actinacidiphila acididurans]
MDSTAPGRTAGHAARVSAYATAGARLALFSDRRLAQAVAAAPGLGTGIGGRSAELEIEGVRVFVKRVPLTDIELRPEHVRSTANLFGLPLFYQYGVGSAGFGAWRELAAHLMTTGWVLKNEYAGFPLLYHWRVLPDSPPEGFADQFGGIEGAVAHWDGAPAVRRRLEAIGRSSSSLVLFLEYVPRTLAAWLGEARKEGEQGPEQEREHGPEPESAPYTWVEDELIRGTQFMSARGLVHFDAHFANLLTDGRQVYFADFGLALSREFELSATEEAFLTDHLVYDGSYAPAHLLRFHLPDGVRGGSDHETFLRDWVAGRRLDGVPPGIGRILDRHAPHALVLDDFHRRLLTRSKRTPFPAAEVRHALAGTYAAG